jgi:hypothetical protein
MCFLLSRLPNQSAEKLMLGLLVWWSAPISKLSQASLICFLLARLLKRMCKINYVGTAGLTLFSDFETSTTRIYVFSVAESSKNTARKQMLGPLVWSSDSDVQSITDMFYVFCFLLSSYSKTISSSLMAGLYV